MDGMFNLEVSVFGYPRGVNAIPEGKDEKADVADIKERYVAALSLLAPGGEYRSWPVRKNEIPAVKRLPKKLKERVAVDLSNKKYSWDTTPDVMVIRVQK